MSVIRQGNVIAYVMDRMKGINTQGDRVALKDKWFADLLNCYLEVNSDGSGAIQQRYGLQELNSTVIGSATTKIRHMTEARWDSGTKELIVRAGTAWYRVNESTGAATSLDGSRTSDAKGQAVMWNNELFMVDGGTPRKSDSSYSVSNLTADVNAPTDSTAIHVHGTRLWLNSAGSPMKIYGSASGDPTDYTSASDAITIDLSQVLSHGDKVIGFKSMGSNLMAIFLRDQIAIYYAPATFADIEVVQILEIGCLSNNAISQVGADVAYPSKSGLKSLAQSQVDKSLDLNDVTKNYANRYREYLDNESDVESICGAYNSRLNHLYVTIHESNDSQTIAYGAGEREVVGRFQFHANPYSMTEGQDGTFYIGMDDGKIYKFSDTTDNDGGELISFKASFPPFGSESLNLYKHPRIAEIVVESNNSLTLYLDYGFGFSGDTSGSDALTITVSTSKWRSATWRSSRFRGKSKVLKKDFDMVGRGRVINITLRHDTANAKIRIPSFLLKALLGSDK